MRKKQDEPNGLTRRLDALYDGIAPRVEWVGERPNPPKNTGSGNKLRREAVMPLPPVELTHGFFGVAVMATALVTACGLLCALGMGLL